MDVATQWFVLEQKKCDFSFVCNGKREVEVMCLTSLILNQFYSVCIVGFIVSSVPHMQSWQNLSETPAGLI